MEFIRTIREKQQTARQENIQKEAERVITLGDFADSIYIAYNGVPIISIADTWTPKQIIDELLKIRKNYVTSKIHDGRGVAVL